MFIKFIKTLFWVLISKSVARRIDRYRIVNKANPPTELVRAWKQTDYERFMADPTWTVGVHYSDVSKFFLCIAVIALIFLLASLQII